MKQFPRQVINGSSENLNYQLSLKDVELILVTLDSMNRLADDSTLTPNQAIALSLKFYRFDSSISYPMDNKLFDTLYDTLFEYRFDRGLLKPEDEDIQILHDVQLGSYAYVSPNIKSYSDEN